MWPCDDSDVRLYRLSVMENFSREDAHAADGVQAYMAGAPANYPPEQ